MMNSENVSEIYLKETGTIETSFVESLSWKYLCFVHENPVKWHVPTTVLYEENDILTDKKTITAFVERNKASLTVM